MSDLRQVGRGSKSWLWIAGGVLIGLGVGLAVLIALRGGGVLSGSAREAALPPALPEVDAPAPDFKLETLDGQSRQISALRGRILIINFWATWCGPCRQEMPLLQATQDQHAGQVLALAVNNAESPQTVKKFVDELGLRMDILLDPEMKVSELYRVRGFPTTIFVDQQGVIRYQHVGVLNQGSLSGYLEALGVKP